MKFIRVKIFMMELLMKCSWNIPTIINGPVYFMIQVILFCNALITLSFIDHYHERIRMFHVKDAEFNPTGKQGVYGGYQSWINRAGRFRSLG